ncbi:uncharacterized protein LOC143237702 [Tachypleus tridentatus]|uniref:uncharacterized protein LOC143237702 n=1 Tax=Tachypleus tridentatus TaxID=6853 RepID=UPI003FD28C53
MSQKCLQRPEISDSSKLINSLTQENSQKVIEDDNKVSHSDHQQVPHFSQPNTHQQIVLQTTPTQKPKNIESQGQKKQQTKTNPQDWSPVSDLSPIMDVSPSVEAAEQEFMEKFRQKSEEAEKSKSVVHATIPRATSGTISGMIADFNKTLGLSGGYTVENQQSKVNLPRSINMSPLHSSAREAGARKDQNQNVVHQNDEKEYQEISKPDEDNATVELPPQPSPSRRIHRRLPQPTMEQMQAAVVMAAQTPKGKASSQTVVKSIDPQNSLGNVKNVHIKPLSAAPPVSSSNLHDNKQSEQQILVENSSTDQIDLTLTANIHQTDDPSNQTSQHLTNQKAFALSQSVQSLTSPVVLMCGVTSFVTSSTTTMTTVTSRQVVAGATILEPICVESKPPALEVGKDLCIKDSSSSGNGSSQNHRTVKDKTSENSDTQSDPDNWRSGKIRRKLPPLPRDQEPSPIPARKSKDRTRNLSIGSTPVHLAENGGLCGHHRWMVLLRPGPLET